jgi:uncharacterized protein YdhG (YjbR/CyaY superfamily)
MLTGKPAHNKIRAYIAALPPGARTHFRKFRAAIRAAVPGGNDVVSYGIPAIQYSGRMLLWYAAFKAHCSLFPMGAAIRRTYAAAIRGYRTSAGTIRFPWDDQPSATLVRRLVKARIGEMRKTASTRKAHRRPRSD